MVYEDSEDQLMGLDQTEIYEQQGSDSELIDTFREHIPGDASNQMGADETIEGETASDSSSIPIAPMPDATAEPESAAAAENSFGESINPDSNPHMDELLEDQDLSEEEITQDYFVDE